MLPRGPALVAAMLAVERAGLPFAVYDPAYPAERHAAMDAALRPGLRITDAPGDGRDGVDAGQAPEGGTGIDALVLEEADPARDGSPPGPMPAGTRYALFTSGTTGRPKCLLADGSGLDAFLARARADWDVTPADRVAFLGGLGHDPMLRDVLLPLTAGATLCVPPEDARRDPASLFAWMRDAAITVAHLTPQLARIAVIGARGEGLPALRRVVLGGDALPATLAADMRDVMPRATITNLYGATETPQAASLFDLPRSAPSGDRDAAPDWTVCPVGRGAGARRLVLDRDGVPGGLRRAGRDRRRGTRPGRDLRRGLRAGRTPPRARAGRPLSSRRRASPRAISVFGCPRATCW